MTQDKPPADRQERWKASLAERGVKQLNVLAPVELHGVLKEVAERTRKGEAPGPVLVQIGKRLNATAAAHPLPDIAPRLVKQADYAREHGVSGKTVTMWKQRGYLTMDGALVDANASDRRLAELELGRFGKSEGL